MTPNTDMPPLHVNNRSETTRFLWDDRYQRMRCANCGSRTYTLSDGVERCDGCTRRVTNG